MAGISKGEIIWTEYRNSDGVPVMLMTSKPTRDVYYLYDISGADCVRMGKAGNPRDLEEKFDIRKIMCQTN